MIAVRSYLNGFIDRNFHALTHRNFRYYWYGQCVSLIGTWAQNIGQSWLVLSVTDSPFLLGLVSTMQFLPVTLFSLFAGLVIDRFPKKKIIIVTQSIAMVLAFTLSFLVFTNRVQYWHVLILAFLLGLSNTVDMPARQSFNVEIVGKKDLMNAITLNSATFNLARIIGPAIGAFMMQYLGPGWCFLVNGLSFMAVIYGLFRIDVPSYVREKKKDSSIIKEIREGLSYMVKTPIILMTILMAAVMGIFAFNFNVLIPVFTKNVLLREGDAYGFLLSCLGIGSLIGALLASFRSKNGPNKKIMITSTLIISLMLILVGISKIYIAAAIFIAIMGIFNISFSTTANSTVQINSKDEFRGRVMSIYTLVFVGTAPIGSFLSGYISETFGADKAFIFCGVATATLILLLVTIIKKKKTLEN